MGISKGNTYTVTSVMSIREMNIELDRMFNPRLGNKGVSLFSEIKDVQEDESIDKE